jgi:hypothetical protein
METENFIPVVQLCSLYKVETSFFNQLDEVGLIEIITIEKVSCLHQDRISDIEKMIRMHHELNVNIEGIDVVFNLLHKVDGLQNELALLRSRLGLYENKE